jgi:hypothetical protein
MAHGVVCGVLLTEDAYEILGEAIAPYVSEGAIGKYIYCKSAQQNGSFLDMIFSPGMAKGSNSGDIRISIPIGFVRFIASSDERLPIGFSPNE